MKTYGDDPINGHGEEYHDNYQRGLTKREYFAAMAMQGILAGGEHWELYNGTDETSSKFMAGVAVQQADALIEALNGK